MIAVGFAVLLYVVLTILMVFLKYGDSIRTTPRGQMFAALIQGSLCLAVLLVGLPHIGAALMGLYFGFNFLGTPFMVGKRVDIDGGYVFAVLMFDALLLWGTFAVFI